jgi:hypothetical protein
MMPAGTPTKFVIQHDSGVRRKTMRCTRRRHGLDSRSDFVTACSSKVSARGATAPKGIAQNHFRVTAKLEVEPQMTLTGR